jgi:hypothetical protein
LEIYFVLSHSPCLVTLDIGRSTYDQAAGSEPLCFAEQLSIVDEIADLGVGQLRLLFHDREEIESVVRLTEYARRRRCAVTVVLRTEVEESLIREISALKPAAIAIPLHSHAAALHQAIAGRVIEWSRSIHLAAAVWESGAELEIESAIATQNAFPLQPLCEVVEALHASSWRLDFSRSSLPHGTATAAANAIVHAASACRTRITVHDLPLLRGILRRPLGEPQRNPPFLTTTASADSMHLTWFGDVRTGETATPIAGSVRIQTLAAIYELSPQFVALRSSASRRATSARPLQDMRSHLHA